MFLGAISGWRDCWTHFYSSLSAPLVERYHEDSGARKEPGSQNCCLENSPLPRKPMLEMGRKQQCINIVFFSATSSRESLGGVSPFYAWKKVCSVEFLDSKNPLHGVQKLLLERGTVRGSTRQSSGSPLYPFQLYWVKILKRTQNLFAFLCLSRTCHKV